jgi:hypothetical protein
MASAQKIRTTAFAASTTSWSALVSDGSFDVTIPAVVGDWVQVGFSVIAPSEAVHGYVDIATMNGNTPISWVSTATNSHAASASGGLPGGYTPSFYRVNSSVLTGGLYRVKATDIVGGNVTFRVFTTGHIAATWICSSSDPAALFATTRVAGPGGLAPDTTSYVGWGASALMGPLPAAIPLAASILWLRGSSLGATGTIAGTWPDLSPAARSVTYSTLSPADATVAGASTPKFGKSVAFPGGTGGPSYVIGASALATNRDGEVWLVLKSNDTNTNGSSKWGGDAGQMNHYSFGGTVYDDAGCNTRQSQDGTGITSWHIYRVQTIGTTRNVWRGTTLIWTAAVTPFWRQSPIVGGNTGATYFFNGNIAEVIQFSRALTTGEAADTHAYLNAEHF